MRLLLLRRRSYFNLFQKMPIFGIIKAAHGKAGQLDEALSRFGEKVKELAPRKNLPIIILGLSGREKGEHLIA